VIGVMRPGPSIPYGAEVWAPLAYTDTEWRERARGFLLVIARLSGAHGMEAARTEMRAIVERQRREHPDTNARREVSVVTFTRGLSDAGAGPFLMICTPLLLLLIACANIANLLLAQARSATGVRQPRARAAVATSVQATRRGSQIARPSPAGGPRRRGCVAPAARRPSLVAGYEFLQVDLTVIALTGVMGLLATLGFSVLPALHASRAVVGDALRQGGRTLTTGRSRRWLGTTLAAGQVALTLTLVVGSALILGAVDSAVNGVLGFEKAHVMTARLTLSDRPYAEPEARREFVDGVLERLAGMPAVQSLGAAAFLPYGGSSNSADLSRRLTLTPAEVVAPADSRLPADQAGGDDRGRDVSDADREDSRAVAVVTGASRIGIAWSPLGRRFRTSADGPGSRWSATVDIMHDWFMQQRRRSIGRCGRSRPSRWRSWRGATGPAATRARCAGSWRRTPTSRSWASHDGAGRGRRVSGITYLARALAVMGSIALVLALTGVYSLVAYLAARRTQEFGVRMALGATRWEVMRLTIRQALVITSLGLGMGSGLAWGLGRLMASSLFGLVSLEVGPLAVMVGLIGVTALAAGYLPARRAANLDPTVALRTN
jgi:hypothetical protein